MLYFFWHCNVMIRNSEFLVLNLPVTNYNFKFVWFNIYIRK